MGGGGLEHCFSAGIGCDVKRWRVCMTLREEGVTFGSWMPPLVDAVLLLEPIRRPPPKPIVGAGRNSLAHWQHHRLPTRGLHHHEPVFVLSPKLGDTTPEASYRRP